MIHPLANFRNLSFRLNHNTGEVVITLGNTNELLSPFNIEELKAIPSAFRRTMLEIHLEALSDAFEYGYFNNLSC